MKKTRCSVVQDDGKSCERPVHAGEMCAAHVMRQRQGRDLAAPIRTCAAHRRIRTKSCIGAHFRVYRARGKAVEQTCGDCGGPGHEWALIHERAIETHFDGDGREWSLDITDYSPKCRSCHRRYDRAYRIARDAA